MVKLVKLVKVVGLVPLDAISSGPRKPCSALDIGFEGTQRFQGQLTGRGA